MILVNHRRELQPRLAHFWNVARNRKQPSLGTGVVGAEDAAALE